MNETTFLPTTESRCLHLPGVFLFPGMTLSVHIKSAALLREIEQTWREKQPFVLTPHQSALNGCLVEVQSFHFDHHHHGQVVLHGVSRAHWETVDGVSTQVESVHDDYNGKMQPERVSLRKKLLAGIVELLSDSLSKQMLLPALESEIPFGLLCDLVATGCQLSPEEYESLLGELDVDLRCELLCKFIRNERISSRQTDFLPSFSSN